MSASFDTIRPPAAPLSPCLLTQLEHENLTLLRALGKAQQRSSDALVQLQQQLHETRKAMHWWRTLALQHLPGARAAAPEGAQAAWQRSQQAAAQCQQLCLGQDQALRASDAAGQPWCQQQQAPCVLDAESLPLPAPHPAGRA